MEAVTQSAAALVEIGEQPAFAMQILQVLDGGFEILIVAGSARRDPLAHESIDAVDERLLFLGESEIHGSLALATIDAGCATACKASR